MRAEIGRGAVFLTNSTLSSPPQDVGRHSPTPSGLGAGFRPRTMATRSGHYVDVD
jgi:hypothetical protein